MKTVAVIPAYNEEKRLAAAVKDAAKFVDAVVVIDDCSRDRTAQIALSAGAYVLPHLINRGQGAALQTGTEFALQKLSADIVVHFDADGQMMGEDIPNMIKPIADGKFDVVLGSRFKGKKSNMPFSRKITIRLALLFTILMSGMRLSDTHNGFRALSREAASKIKIKMNRMAHASEILDLIQAKKLRYTEVPVKIKYTEDTLDKGQSFFSGFAILKDYFKGKFFDEV